MRSLTPIALGFAAIALTLTSASASRAQSRPRVEVLDFTFDGDPPPSSYRQMLADGIAPTITRIERCYDQRLGASQRTAGDYRLRLWVSARQVIRVTPETSVGDTTLEECTRTAVRTFTLPPEAPSGGTTVRFVVRFTPPPAPSAPSAPAEPPTTPTIRVPDAVTPPIAPLPIPHLSVAIRSRSGGLDADTITSLFPSALFEPCASGITGTLPLTVNVSTRGRVTAAASRGTTRSASAAACVARAARTVTAPATRRASTIRLSLTFRE